MTRTRGLLLIAFVGFLTAGGIWANNWFAQVSERVLTAVNQQTGLRLSNSQITFDLPERRLSVRDIHIEHSGIVLSARRASVVLNYPNWWSPWLGDDVQSLSDIELEGADITIDPQHLPLGMPEWFRSATIERGTVAINGISQSVPFQQLRLRNEGGLQVEFNPVESWQFSGTYDQGLLSGELELHQLPLTLITGSDQSKGLLGGKLSLSWRLADGWSLNGTVQGEQGQWLLPQGTLSWQHWQLDNIKYDSRAPDSSFAELSISGGDLKLAASEQKIIAADLLQQLLPFTRTDLTINDSRLEFGDWVFSHLAGTVAAIDDGWQYKLSAHLNDVGAVQLSGQLGASHDWLLKLTDARIAGPINDYGHLAGYRLNGARFNLSYDSQNRRGQVSFLAWPESSASLQALLTDPKHNTRIDFALNTGTTPTPLPQRLYRAIGQRLKDIARTPLDYLHTATGARLEPTLRHEAGRATLTPTAVQNLQHLKQIMTQRPALTAAIEVGVSPRDRPELTRQALEVALLELYHAMGAKEENMPAEVRGQLLEQMHLATQQKKIPEVGELTPEQRVQRAEQWLLANWPVANDQLEMLQQARYELLLRTLSEIGLDARRIELTRATLDQLRSEPDSVLTLR